MKIGGTKIGGVFLGKNLQSALHRHHFIVLVLSTDEPFQIGYADRTFASGKVALIPQDMLYSLTTTQSSMTFFAHFDPYTAEGLRLSPIARQVQFLDHSDFLPVLKDIEIWSSRVDTVPGEVERIMLRLLAVVTRNSRSPRNLDSRVLSVIELVGTLDIEDVDLKSAASSVFLSPSRFSHLFRNETGVTFRKFIQHRKLVRALLLLHTDYNLTEIAFSGGFSDQPHFTKTFVNTFGITPSKSKQ